MLHFFFLPRTEFNFGWKKSLSMLRPFDGCMVRLFVKKMNSYLKNSERSCTKFCVCDEQSTKSGISWILAEIGSHFLLLIVNKWCKVEQNERWRCRLDCSRSFRNIEMKGYVRRGIHRRSSRVNFGVNRAAATLWTLAKRCKFIWRIFLVSACNSHINYQNDSYKSCLLTDKQYVQTVVDTVMKAFFFSNLIKGCGCVCSKGIAIHLLLALLLFTVHQLALPFVCI